MPYVHLPVDWFETNDGYAARALRREDMPAIRTWRNSQMDVLRQAHALSEDDQTRYFDQVVEPSFRDPHTRIVLLSLVHDQRLVGYGGLTNIDWPSGRAELSFLVAAERARDPATYARDFRAFLRLIKQVTFQTLGFNRLFTETFDVRPAHVDLLEEAGFRPEGRLRQHARVGDRLVDSLMHGLLREDLTDEGSR